MKKIINIDEQLIIGYFDDSEKDKTIETLELVWEYVSYDIDGDICVSRLPEENYSI